VDVAADALFRTLSVEEIRERQDICRIQVGWAVERNADEDALADLQAMEDALFREMLRRTAGKAGFEQPETCEDRGWVCCDMMPPEDGEDYRAWYDRHVESYRLNYKETSDGLT
jgi:hypothetical protein